ncbi:hypothetical protein WJR50_24925 [Catalinimonas sp. 4WD22]|uniref:hypothetical protein n=1 Tax=Catalinimonas locisalis TaxID=3133978 RepID=UPI003101AFA4
MRINLSVFSTSGRISIMSMAMLFSIFSCSEEDPVSENDDMQSEQIVYDEAMADDLFEDMDEISMEAATYSENGRVKSSLLSSLACLSRTVARDNSNLSQLVTLTFGEGCKDSNGRIRSGKIVVTRSIDVQTASYTLKTTFEDFYVNEYKIEGTRTIVYTANADQKITATITLENGKISLPDGSVITRSASYTKQIDREAGEISLTGSAQGINRNGVSYVATTTSPMIYKTNCALEGIFMASSGQKMITRSGKKTLKVDYGNGTCDRTLSLNVDGVERTLELNFSE